jgi:hypothetical protein
VCLFTYEETTGVYLRLHKLTAVVLNVRVRYGVPFSLLCVLLTLLLLLLLSVLVCGYSTISLGFADQYVCTHCHYLATNVADILAHGSYLTISDAHTDVQRRGVKTV